jgi:hypothetical protein
VANPNNYYYVGLRSGQLVIGRRSAGTISTLASTPFAATTGTWYKLSLNLFFSGTVRGSVVPAAGGTGANVSATDPGGSNFGGAVGFWTLNASASFDDIVLADDRIVPTSSTPPPTGGCAVQVTYAILSQWQPNYFQAGFTLRNRTTATIPAGWILTWRFTNGETIQNLFNAASWRQIGPTVTVTGPVWAPLPPGGSIANVPGFIGIAPNGPRPVADVTFNGVPC